MVTGVLFPRWTRGMKPQTWRPMIQSLWAGGGGQRTKGSIPGVCTNTKYPDLPVSCLAFRYFAFPPRCSQGMLRFSAFRESPSLEWEFQWWRENEGLAFWCLPSLPSALLLLVLRQTESACAGGAIHTAQTAGRFGGHGRARGTL